MAKKADPTPDAGKPAEPGPPAPLDPADLAHALEATQSALMDSTARAQAAYTERNRCVAAIARAALALGCRAWLGKHPAEETSPPVATWDPEWTTIVFILLPAGQASWHIHDSEVPAFAFLVDMPPVGDYDGHTTPEKYERLEAWEPKRG
jgi:hypothetical protein